MYKGLLTIAKNKVVWYLVSRYFTFFVEFLTSLIIAAKLGPFYFGVWGCVLLLLNYFQQVHFGIANSVNVLLVHNIHEKNKCDAYIANSMALVAYLSLFVILIYMATIVFDIPVFPKYGISRYWFCICLIGILQYFRMLFINIFRVYNKLGYIIFSQSIIVFLNFCVLFLFNGERLILALLGGYLIGNLASFLLALSSNIIPRIHLYVLSKPFQAEILKKGCFLFLYNSCFYFILIFIRTIVSSFYSVEEFGVFTFSFTLANAMLLLLDAVAFVVFPKLISRLSSPNVEDVRRVMKSLQCSYVTSAHVLVYGAILCFPLIYLVIPQYKGSSLSFSLISQTILINTSSFVYTTTMISRNMETKAAQISLTALLLNGILGLLLACLFQVRYEFVVLATMASYFIFTLMSAFCTYRALSPLSKRQVLCEVFPLNLVVPFLLSLIVSLSIVPLWANFIPLFVFVLLNKKEIQYLMRLTSNIMQDSKIVNL